MPLGYLICGDGHKGNLHGYGKLCINPIMEFDASYRVESERLVIRAYTRDDALEYQSFMEEMGGMRMCFERAVAAVRDKSMMFYPRSTISLAAVGKHDGQIKSHITLSPYEHRVRTLGYGTRPSAQNQGYMREALNMVLCDVFARHILNGMVADVRHDNVHSRKVLARAGFTQDLSQVQRDGWMTVRRMA